MPSSKPETTIDHDQRLLRVGESEYALIRGFEPDGGDRPLMLKTPTMVARYLELLDEVAPERIVEIGVFNGTSTAAIAEVCPDATIVAVELNPVAPEFLTEFIERTGRQATLRTHYGVDQSDTERIRAILDAELGDAPLDLVIDDASHQLGPTRASFELLFPRLRPGGVYVIEDWEVNQRFGRVERPAEEVEAMSAPERELYDLLTARPLIELPLQLLVAAGDGNDHVAGVRAGECMFEVVRGDTELDPVGFRVEDLYDDHLGVLRR